MSIGTALNAALSGLAATSRAAATVSSNVANAMTEGYMRRELVLSARSVGDAGQGVRIDGERRIQDAALLADRRAADASAGASALTGAALGRIAAALGTPDEDGSLSDRFARLDAALIAAAGRPEDEGRLGRVVDAARALSGGLNDVSAAILREREAPDRSIAAQVDRLNAALEQVHTLNRDILRLGSGGHSTAAQEDQRQRTIDSIAEILPLRQLDRPGGAVVLYTHGGVMLLEAKPARIGFEPTAVIDPQMTVENGALSGLTVNGRAVSTGAAVLGAGTLAAAFDLRDGLVPKAQGWVDALAQDMVQRFASPTADPTLPPGTAGLFTDGGAALVPAPAAGLAGRIAVNPMADPATGGALWRLRDGLAAVTPGPPGRSDGLQALADAMSGRLPPPAGAAVATPGTLDGHAGALSGHFARLGLNAEADTAHAGARRAALRAAEARGGVDTDAELQTLLVIEKAYAANARVIRTVDEMLQTMLRL